MANAGMMAKSCLSDSRKLLLASKKGHPPLNAQTRSYTPAEENEDSGFLYIWKALQKQGIPRDAKDIIINSWRDSIRKQYGS